MLTNYKFISGKVAKPMNLELNEEERETRKHAFDVYLSDLREEVVKTEAHTWKRDLHQEEAIIKKILEKIS